MQSHWSYSPAGAKGSSGGIGPGRPEAAPVYQIKWWLFREKLHLRLSWLSEPCAQGKEHPAQLRSPSIQFFIYAKVNTNKKSSFYYGLSILSDANKTLNLDMRIAAAHSDTNVSMHDACRCCKPAGILSCLHNQGPLWGHCCCDLVLYRWKWTESRWLLTVLFITKWNSHPSNCWMLKAHGIITRDWVHSLIFSH